MTRSVRPLLAALAAGALLLTGCATTVQGTAQPAGPAVGSSEAAPNVPSSGESTETSGTESAPTEESSTESAPTEESSTEGSPTAESSTEGSPTEEQTSQGGDDVQQFASMIASGMADVTSYEGTMKLDMGGGGIGAMDGKLAGTLKDGVAVNSKATISISASGQKLDFTMLAIGSKVYVGGDVFVQAVPEAKGKEWIYADPNSKNSIIAQLAKSTSTVQTNNVAAFAKFAESAKSVRKGGTTTVNGVDVTQYEVELDLSKVAGAEAAGSGTATATYYLDQDDRMRRVQVDMEIQGQKVATIVDMTSYNEPVDISAPDPSTVYTG